MAGRTIDERRRTQALPDTIGDGVRTQTESIVEVCNGFAVSDLSVEVTDPVDGTRRTFAPADLPLVDVFEAAPARRIPNSPRRLNRIGWYWSTTTGGHHAFESAMEAEVIRWLDWRADVVAIATQPFRLSATVDALRDRRHVPDVLVELGNGSFELINVKPAHRHMSLRSLQASAMCEAAALKFSNTTYSIMGALAEPLRSNLRFRAQYRHDVPAGLLPAAFLYDLVGDGSTVADVVERSGAPFNAVLPPLMHLIWHRSIGIDWEAPISDRSEVWLPTNASAAA